MQELRIVVSDEEGAELTFEPIGFGMWADRPEMQDAAKWVADLRERQWKQG